MTLSPLGGFKCEILSWSTVQRDAKRLSWTIKDSGYIPDIIIAIGRGGYVPARILCDYLSMNELTAIKVEHWGMAALKREKAVVKFPLNVKIDGKKVLLVDDLTDTGETLRVSVMYLKKFRPKEVRTAVLLHKTCSAMAPDYFVRKVTKWRWVIFPWHLWEDLTGFIKKFKAEGIHREGDIRREFHRRYGIDVRTDVLAELLSRLG
ncbi:MAG TPA: phosphoribosyltransferase [Dissulfurispiraceae bacterium]|nr:phosphoribosyltransferase [Dissulfurispiraceae bacterium]